MKEVKEPEIKLFGRKILLPDNGGTSAGGVSSVESSDESNCGSGSGGGGGDCVRSMEVNGEKSEDEKQLPAEEDQTAKLSETKMQEKDQNTGTGEESLNPTVSSEFDENTETPLIDEDATSENNPKPENELPDAPDGAQKLLKKPDKILPCPRCNSMETKFCYYNNYNVNQPRHFCKSCQRYWTAGGTMRNVPVGAGRRKNKNSNSHCRHITISEALQAGRIDPPNGFHQHKGFKPNSSVLSFGPDTPLCESMASTLNLAEKRGPNGVRNGYCKTGENKDDSSMGSSVTTSGSVPKLVENCPQEQVMPNMNGIPYPVPCMPGVAWPFPALPLPTMCPPGYPMPFYPTPYWNCGIPNAWNVVPWVSAPSPSANQRATGSGPNSPLGKHSRNGELLKPNGSGGQECPDLKSSESSIVVPKTLRIDDPEEAAKSSIWETLGIKYDSVSREGLFKALQPKGDEKKVTVSASPVLHANPAALSRSINFRESA